MAVFLALGVLETLNFFGKGHELISPLGNPPQKTPALTQDKYLKYSFEALSKREFTPVPLKLEVVLKKEKSFTSFVFTYLSDGKTISGMANIPKGNNKFPVIILLRGWADREYYHVGLGTERSANFLAEHGFLTLAPDFLGYGYSDWEDKDILLARFYRPVEVLNLIAALSNLPSADSSRIGLWGHSNGGQIVLSILEITGKNYPVSLWAPVSLGFPENVFVYLGTQEEVGNMVKDKVEEFLQTHDPRKYSISEYMNRIKSPFIIHQATADELIKTQWTRDLVARLRNQGLSVDFYLYSKENHNFNRYKETGEVLRKRDLEFFRRLLKQ